MTRWLVAIAVAAIVSIALTGYVPVLGGSSRVTSAQPSSRPVAAAADNAGHLYVLDGWGGLHPANGSPSLPYTGYQPGWDIARGLAVFPAGDGGYSLDGWGRLHQFGSAPLIQQSSYWSGWDIARSIALAPWADAAHPDGWILDGYGGIHPFGSAPSLASSTYWPGWDIARGLVVLPGSQPTAAGGYILDGWGGLHPVGNAPPVGWSAYWRGWDIARSISILPGSASPGGYVLDGWGGLHAFGSAPQTEWSAYWPGWDIARSLVQWSGASATSPGGWVLDGWGALHPFGSAPSVGYSAYWPGWDIARSTAGSGTASGGRGLGTRVLGVPAYRQIHSLDCEAAALQMALAYRGFNISQDAILGAMPDDPRSGYFDATGLRWGDPYTAFVGSVDGSTSNHTGYGVYFPPIVSAAQHFGAGIARAGEGVAPADVYAAVLGGHPVVAWVTTDWGHHTGGYQAFDGRWVMYSPVEHAVAVAGVSDSSVLVNNPLSGPQWISKSTFESAFSSFDNMAVIVV